MLHPPAPPGEEDYHVRTHARTPMHGQAHTTIMCTSISACLYVHISLPICTYQPAYMYISACLYVHISLPICTHQPAYMYISACLCTYQPAYMFISACLYVHSTALQSSCQEISQTNEGIRGIPRIGHRCYRPRIVNRWWSIPTNSLSVGPVLVTSLHYL